MSRVKLFFADTAPTLAAVFGIGIYDVHAILSAATLAVSFTYSLMKLKQDFFNNNSKNKNNDTDKQ